MVVHALERVKSGSVSEAKRSYNCGNYRHSSGWLHSPSCGLALTARDGVVKGTNLGLLHVSLVVIQAVLVSSSAANLALGDALHRHRIHVLEGSDCKRRRREPVCDIWYTVQRGTNDAKRRYLIEK